jgi:hypothetical protein
MIVAINDSPQATQKISELLSSLSVEVQRGCVIKGPNITISDIAIQDQKAPFHLQILSKIKSWFHPNQTPTIQVEENKQEPTNNFVLKLKPFIEATQKMTNLFENIYIQINANNPFTQQKKEDYLAKRMLTVHQYDSEILDSFNSEAGHIWTGYGIMVLGTDILKNFGLNYQKKYSEDEFLGFVYFHELSHQLDVFNQHIKFPKFFQNDKLNNHWSNDSLYQTIFQKLDIFSYIHTAGNFNELLKKSSFINNFSPIDVPILSEIQALQKEFYADVGGLLFLRNTLLSKNPNLNPTEIKERLQSLIECREKELQKHISHYSNNDSYEFEKNLISNSNHLTSRALETLLERIDDIPHQELSVEQIADISRICTNQAMIEHIYLLSQTCPHFRSTLKTLSTLSFDSQSGNIILEEKNIDNYNNFIHFLKNHSQQQWIQKLDENLLSDEIFHLNLFQKFSLGFPSLSENLQSTIDKKIQDKKFLQNTYFYSAMKKAISHYPTTLPSLDSFLESAFSEAPWDSFISDNTYNSLLFPIENIIKNKKFDIIQKTFSDDPNFSNLSIKNLESIISLHRSIYVEIESIQKLFKTKLFSVNEMISFLDPQHIESSTSSLLSQNEISTIYVAIQSQIQQHQSVDFDWDKITEHYYIQALSHRIKNNSSLEKDIRTILSIEYNEMTGLPQKKESSLDDIMKSFETILKQSQSYESQNPTHLQKNISEQKITESSFVKKPIDVISAIQSQRNQRNLEPLIHNGFKL